MAERTLKLAVNGAAGRMGSRVAALALVDARFELAARIFHEGPSEKHGATDFGAGDLPQALAQADMIVDFSSPDASLRALAAAAEAKKTVVIGTTGFSSVQKAQIGALSKRVPVFLSANFSRGVAVLGHLARELGRMLPGYDAALSEVHHKEKKDAPSGTALRLAQILKEGRPDETKIPIASQRIGDVVGEHALVFAGPYERVEIIHRAHSRALFALGALDAAFWLRKKKPGLYGMDDLLRLK